MPLFAIAENATVPGPVPLAPDEIESHVALLVALHEQPAGVATLKVPVPPPEPTVRDEGVTV